MSSNKSKIENAAKRLFAERGFHAVTTRDVAQEAQVPLSAISYHFKSKDQLLVHLSKKFLETQSSIIVVSFQPATNLTEFKVRIEVFLESLIMSLLQDIESFRMFRNEVNRKNQVLVAAGIGSPDDSRLTMLVEFFQGAQKSGVLAADIDPKMAALLILHETMHAVLLDDITPFVASGSLKNEPQRKQWITSLLRIFLGGIAAKS